MCEYAAGSRSRRFCSSWYIFRFAVPQLPPDANLKWNCICNEIILFTNLSAETNMRKQKIVPSHVYNEIRSNDFLDPWTFNFVSNYVIIHSLYFVEFFILILFSNRNGLHQHHSTTCGHRALRWDCSPSTHFAVKNQTCANFPPLDNSALNLWFYRPWRIEFEFRVTT